MRYSKISYNPFLSVEENAKQNNVSVAAVRYYIRANKIDRSRERKLFIIKNCQYYLKQNPNMTRNELHEKTGHSLSTIREYWNFIIGKETVPITEKTIQRQKVIENKIKFFENIINTYKNNPDDISFTKDFIEFNSTNNKKQEGEVYVMQNPLFPHILKIGKSTDAKKRRHQMQTSVPDDYLILYKIKVPDCKSAEIVIHKYFSDKHYRREFYEISAEEALKCFKLISQMVNSEVEIIDTPIKIISKNE